ncbi:MAG TPA: thioredoxin family protein [Phnomibacter sp.]|nr:thioredoxin family protein [Phnomibacter sp.]
MKKLIAAALAIGTGLFAVGQPSEKGIRFEHGTTWQAVLAKAKRENKYIFVDAFTTWCGPCKAMAKNIFPQEEVGRFFNANFINLKVQLDTTVNDNIEVKLWYKDAHDIMVNYQVKVFPTYLFISPNGMLAHRAVGASDAATFIQKGKNALDPAKQYYTLLQHYKAGDQGPGLLKMLAEAATEAYELEAASEFAGKYLRTQSDLFTAENVAFLNKFTNNTSDTGFILMLKHPEKFEAVLGKAEARTKVRFMILGNDLLPKIFNAPGAPQWEEITTNAEKLYGPAGKEAVASAKLYYYQREGLWNEFSEALLTYTPAYPDNLRPLELNYFARSVLENCDDRACLERAVEMGKKAAEVSDPAYKDTYANLLYKAGKKVEAIKAQEEAIALAKSTNHSNTSGFESNLQKMKKGERTW